MLATAVALIRPTLEGAVSASQTAFLSVLPHGGQGSARRNAYRAVLLDETAAAQRRRVYTAVDRAAAAPRLVSLPMGPQERYLGHA